MIDRINFVNTRDLKNKTNEILRAAEQNISIIVTRHGKPIATIKPFSPEDLQEPRRSLYQQAKDAIAQEDPELLTMTDEELKQLNDRISQKVVAFSSWQEMDKAVKGDYYGLSR